MYCWKYLEINKNKSQRPVPKYETLAQTYIHTHTHAYINFVNKWVNENNTKHYVAEARTTRSSKCLSGLCYIFLIPMP